MRPHPRPPPRLLLFGISSSTLAPCHFFGCPACAGQQGAAKGLSRSLSVRGRNRHISPRRPASCAHALRRAVGLDGDLALLPRVPLTR